MYWTMVITCYLSQVGVDIDQLVRIVSSIAFDQRPSEVIVYIAARRRLGCVIKHRSKRDYQPVALLDTPT